MRDNSNVLQLDDFRLILNHSDFTILRYSWMDCLLLGWSPPWFISISRRFTHDHEIMFLSFNWR